MILSVITINRNNAAGLEKTMQSVLSQTRADYEYVVVDGASTDGSVAVIERLAPAFGDRLKWISEPDKGIYNAMNKGIGMAKGDYLLFLNSGDYLVSENVVKKVSLALVKEGFPPIMYGNLVMVSSDSQTRRISSLGDDGITFRTLYSTSLPHPSSFIRRSLFDKYGLYDESLKWMTEKIFVCDGTRLPDAVLLTYYTVEQVKGKKGYAIKAPFDIFIRGTEDPNDPPTMIINNDNFQIFSNRNCL